MARDAMPDFRGGLPLRPVLLLRGGGAQQAPAGADRRDRLGGNEVTVAVIGKSDSAIRYFTSIGVTCSKGKVFYESANGSDFMTSVSSIDVNCEGRDFVIILASRKTRCGGVKKNAF